MKDRIREQVRDIFSHISPHNQPTIAEALQDIWLEYDPKSIGGIKEKDRIKHKITGAPVKVLRSIGEETGKLLRPDVEASLSLATLLWDEYGREGRIVSSVALGELEMQHPDRVIPEIRSLCQSCITWEDCDQLAMRALEPAVRRNPERWLPDIKAWLMDENKWVQRAGVMVIGRLPMKHPSYTARCLDMIQPLLTVKDHDVRRAVSCAIRTSARGEIPPVREFLAQHVPPQDPAAAWVLCDAVRSMNKKVLPDLKPLLAHYQAWAESPHAAPKDQRSIQSAIKTLKSI